MAMKDNIILFKKGDSKKVIERHGKLYKSILESEKMEANIAELESGSESRWFKHSGEEIHIVLHGELEYIVKDHSYKLSEGDILWHKSNVNHKAKNNSDNKVVYLTIGTPPSFKLSMV
jgi:quercetin dioxygenase-like cupin family protein